MSRIVDSVNLNTCTGTESDSAAAASAADDDPFLQLPGEHLSLSSPVTFFISQTSFEMNSHFLNKIFKR
jgi:hypothetical protein